MHEVSCFQQCVLAKPESDWSPQYGNTLSHIIGRSLVEYVSQLVEYINDVTYQRLSFKKIPLFYVHQSFRFAFMLVPLIYIWLWQIDFTTRFTTSPEFLNRLSSEANQSSVNSMNQIQGH